jgi:nitrite reductase/ring-hydroxylating ferredoxin subunit
MSETWHRVALVDEIDPDFPLGVEVDGTHIALYRVEGRVYATVNECTHAFARLSDGFVEGCHVLCPVHQGRFDVTTGAAVDGPVEDPVRTYPVEVRDGEVFVGL